MDRTILYSLFLDNPELPQTVYRFCEAMPDYRQAEQDYRRAADALLGLIGYERYNHFETALSRYWALEERAHYLFGLGLREELLRGLGAQP